jgi:branched-chain amino acid aminotransferase
VIYTPPAAAILAGITRDTLIRLAEDAGLTVCETPMSRDALYAADEVFVCGTAAEVIGLREIDFRRIGTGAPGPVTRELQRTYRAATRGEHPRSPGWLRHVDDGDGSCADQSSALAASAASAPPTSGPTTGTHA